MHPMRNGVQKSMIIILCHFATQKAPWRKSPSFSEASIDLRHLNITNEPMVIHQLELQTYKKCNEMQCLQRFNWISGSSYTISIHHNPIYTEGTHHVIIALMCTTGHWPFNSVSDKYYKMEVECLHPGTKIPAPKTVSLEINYLYLELLKAVQAYFRVHIQLSWSQLIN